MNFDLMTQFRAAAAVGSLHSRAVRLLPRCSLVWEAKPIASVMAASGTAVNSLIVEPLVPSCSIVSEGAFTTSGASNFDPLSWDSYYRGKAKTLPVLGPSCLHKQNL